MRSKIRIAIILGFLTLCFILPVQAQNSRQQLKDSLHLVIEQSEGKDKLKAYARLYTLYMSDTGNKEAMDTLMTLFDRAEAEAVRQGNVSAQGMVYGNTVIALVNAGRYDEAISKIPGYLDFYKNNKLWRYYYQIHMQLITLYNLKEDYERASEAAGEMYDKAKAQNDKAGMGAALYATSTIYNVQKRFPEQEKCLRECISLLWETSGYDNILTQAYAYLCMSLRAQKRHAEALQLMPEYEKAIARFEKTIGRPDVAARVNYNTALMNNYIDTEEYDKAEIYLAKLEKMTNSSIINFEMLRAKALILQSRGKYKEALASIDSAMMEVQESEIDINSAKEIKIEILMRAGQVDEALDTYQEIIASNKELYDTEVSSRFDELRTQYEVEKHIAEKERNRHYFLFALGGCLILLILLICVFYYNRLITTKNRNLYKQIKEKDSLADELARVIQSSKAAASTTEPQETDPQETDAFVPSTEQCELVSQFREYLLSDNRISNIDISREGIISALRTNKNTLTEAVRAITGKSPMEYMRIMRIEEARKMLDEHSELTIEAIAFSCGFNIPSTFYRMFRKEYGISPTEYRKMQEEQEKSSQKDKMQQR